MSDKSELWKSFVSSRLSPAVAGVLMERLCSNDIVGGISSALGFTIQDMRSAILFATLLALTDPMAYIRALKLAIISCRTFWGNAKNEIDDAIHQPIEEDKK